MTSQVGPAQGGSQVEHHGQAALHVGRAQPPQDVALDLGYRVAVGRDGVEVAGEHHPVRQAKSRSGRPRCRRLRATSSQAVTAQAPPRHGRRSEPSSAGHRGRWPPARPWPPAGRSPARCHSNARPRARASMSFRLGRRVPLAFLQPADDQDAGQAEGTAGIRYAGGSPRSRRTTAGRRPAESSSPVSASITGIPGLRMQPSPRTAPAPTCAPWVIMQRLPIRALSPIITGPPGAAPGHRRSPLRRTGGRPRRSGRSSHRGPGVDHASRRRRGRRC